MDLPISDLLSLGVGGVLAIIIFLMYRRDKNASEKRIADICNTHEHRLREDRNEMTNMIEREQDTREEQTKVLSELTTTLQRMNGKR